MHRRRSRAALAGVRALVVDDHPVNRMVLEAQLAGFGLRASSARDAGEALVQVAEARAGGDPIRLAVIDQCMPQTDGFALARQLHGLHGQDTPRLVLLTSVGRKGDGALARDAGFAGYLTKPARRDQLHDLLEAALGDPGGSELVTRHRLAESSPRFEGRVLLAEDNAVNRQVATAVLRKLGLQVALAENGREALERAMALPHDLVFMDLHMPEMDGLEATLAIRRAEAPLGRRTPIVALTASVLQETRDACTAAGMDGFVPKPFARAQLVEVLRRFLGTERAAAPASPAGTAPAAPAAEALDPERLGATRDAMEEDFPSLVEAYLDSGAALLAELRAADGAAAMLRPAHTLKSSSANLGAMTLSALAAALEADARRGSVPDPAERVAAIAAAFAPARTALLPFLTENSTHGTR